jgi:hypothetical protein
MYAAPVLRYSYSGVGEQRVSSAAGRFCYTMYCVSRMQVAFHFRSDARKGTEASLSLGCSCKVYSSS